MWHRVAVSIKGAGGFGIGAIWASLSVKPEDAMSNAAAWLNLFGFKDIPAWLEAPGADLWLQLAVAAVAVMWAIWVFWQPLRATLGHLRRDGIGSGPAQQRIEPTATTPTLATSQSHPYAPVKYALLRQVVDFTVSEIEPAPGTYRGLGFDAQGFFALGLVILAGQGKVTLYHAPTHGLVEREPIPPVDLRQDAERVDVEASSVVSGSHTEYASVCIARDDLAEVVELIRREIATRND